MAVKSVQMFKATDGKIFDSMDKAMAYDLASTRINLFRSVLSTPTIMQSPSGLAVDLFNSPEICEKLRDACSKALDYHRRYGKLKGQTVKAPKTVKATI